jgi:anti-sigma B factor antagonist
MADEMFRARVDATNAATVVVHVDGEVDLAAVEELRAAIDEARTTPGAEVIELDLAGVTFIDSSGVGAIVLASRAVADANQTMRIGARSAVVERVLEVSGLEEALRAAAD